MNAETGSRFDQVVTLSNEAFSALEYEAAYHMVMAAIHLAVELGDEVRLTQVAELAANQGRLVDALRPDHRLSSRVAGTRGHKSVYQLATIQATSHASMARQRHRPR